ncbi:3-oxoacyl-ACP synthase III family protein [Robiginitalea sp. SC105]|uniref:3-oxoacyl-ACP synthase III family protein n=1 Tax=Robiginitalea sp. SC105 TaxID=2762332 RepID=UPI0016395C92|nr:ketoacyl-ACP synthase III [Robiginitalea sp. SC105]MBC2838316.1 ketoacyl-ACP synthase III [Robiginitalea sp. SC105]
MTPSTCNVITGTGSYIPHRKIRNEDFLENTFFDSEGNKLAKANQEIIEKFLEITTIGERRYAGDELNTSDMAFLAAEAAIEAAGVDRESLDYIIVAHNFGDVTTSGGHSDMVPSLAARVKHKLGIENPDTVAYDMIFGCPGWLESLIQAHYYLSSGEAKRALVIGADMLSRISDPHDRDSLIYSDGAGAVILEARPCEKPKGILAHKTRSDTLTHSGMLSMGPSYRSGNGDNDARYLKMHGRKLYQYALETVPGAIRACLEKSGVPISEVRKILIHQANGKMDDAILKRLYESYGMDAPPEGVMPMTISWLGNSSVATIPTLLDLLLKGDVESHELEAGDVIIFASVGAGMNVNAMVYRM